MIIVIDGYNVLKGAFYPNKITDNERGDFIARMNNYARIKMHTTVVVFDGGNDPHPERESHDQVTVVYSGYNQTADEYIKEFIDGHRQHEMVLVSTDRELCRFANKHDIVTIDSEDFYALVQNAISHGAQKNTVKHHDIIKFSQTESDVDDIIMAGSSQIPLKHDDASVEIKNRITKNKTASKQDKKLKRALDKL